MKTKEKRQELELAIVKVLEGVLIKEHPEVGKMIRKTTFESAKKLAKKFYKTLKILQPKSKPAKKVPSAPPKKLTLQRTKVNTKLTAKVAKKPVKTIVLKAGNKK
jgi:hypothetical protein